MENMSIRANVNEELVLNIFEKEYGLTVVKLSQLNGYDDLNFHVITATQNEKYETGSCSEYVLKIVNTRESENTEFFNEYVNVLVHLRKEGIPCPQPIKNKNGKYFSYWTDIRKERGAAGNQEPVRRHVVILQTYQHGKLLQNFKCDKEISFALGRLVSKMHDKLQLFNNSKVLMRAEYPWSLQAVPQLNKVLRQINLDKEKYELVLNTITQFEDDVLSKFDELEKGVIHNDMNDANILVQQTSVEGGSTLDIVGVIDFFDMLYSSYLFDIAITITYLFTNNPDDCDNLVTGFLLGYERRHLTDLEFCLLKISICARLCQSLVYGLHEHSINPTNQYVLTTQKAGWNLLFRFSYIDNEKFVDNLRQSLAVEAVNRS